MNSIKKFFNVKNFIYGTIAACILVMWAIMHLYLLGNIPRGLHLDEAGMAYDAYCIANWGVDRYLNPYPIYFYNYGGGMSAAYVYMCALFIKLFAPVTIVYRLPGMLFSLITLISVFFIIRRSFNSKWALLAAFLYCALPYFTTQSRFGLDCNLMLGATSAALLFFLIALDRNKWYWFALDGILWGIVLYTYIVSYMVLPIFLLLMCSYLLAIKKIRIKQLLYAGIPFAIMATPLLIMSIITFLQADPIVTPYFSIPCLNKGRMSEFSLNIFKNIPDMLKSVFINDDIDYNSMYGLYAFYNISLILGVVGLINSIRTTIHNIKNRDISPSFIMLCFFTSMLIIGAFKTDTNMNNMNGIYCSFLFMIVNGIHFIYNFLGRIWRQAAVIIIICIYLFETVSFVNFYFNDYQYMCSYLFTPQLNETYDQLGTFLDGRTIYMDSPYIHYFLEKGYNPYDLNLIVNEEVTNFHNVTFHTIYTPLPDDLSQYETYVIQETNYEMQSILNEAGWYSEQYYGYLVYWK